MSAKSRFNLGKHLARLLIAKPKVFPRYTTDPNPEKGELGFKFVGPKKGKK